MKWRTKVWFLPYLNFRVFATCAIGVVSFYFSSSTKIFILLHHFWLLALISSLHRIFPRCKYFVCWPRFGTHTRTIKKCHRNIYDGPISLLFKYLPHNQFLKRKHVLYLFILFGLLKFVFISAIRRYPQFVRVFPHGKHSVRVTWRGVDQVIYEATVICYKVCII